MCGLFAFDGVRPDPATLEHLAILAATRGPHSHGYAWLPPRSYGEPIIRIHRGMGPLTRSIPTLLGINARTVVGHSRLATTGTYAGGDPQLEDTMPFQRGAVTIVHNGNVPNYLSIAHAFDVTLHTGCDSELIAALMSRAMDQHDPKDALSMSLDLLYGGNDRPYVVIAMTRDGRLYAARRGLPLFAMAGEEGIYLCSRDPEHSSTMEVPEHVVIDLAPGIVSV